ncbi:MAG: UDP-N-acetylmuramoyl-tripeptide--D-alanyl-D-alanine ligase [Patescibacteria group bacterium]
MLKNILKNTLVFILVFLAKIVLRKYKPKIIAVAGSVGKTSTKEAIYTIIKSAHFAWRSPKSYNSELGIPLAILGLKNAGKNPFAWMLNILNGLELITFNIPYPKYLVLEAGADRPGDIKKIVSWLKPDISVITMFGQTPAHIEFFKDREELIDEDGKVVEMLKPDGLLILNQDDADSMSQRAKTKARALTCGFNEKATMSVSNSQIMYDETGTPLGMTYKISYEGNSVPVRILGALGNSSVYASLPALLVGKELGINLLSGIDALLKHQPPPGRLRIIPGLKNTVIVDDTYNSSPVAAEEALRAFNDLRVSGKKIVVLGDMLELGRNSEGAHKEIGKLSAGVCDILVTVGIRARGIAEGALIAGLSEKNVFQFEDAYEAGKFVEGVMEKGDAILVKGSQSMRMERIVEEIMSEPDKKELLLVRQDREWQGK